MLHDIETSKREAANQYRRARESYIVLSGPHELLKELNEEDIRPLRADASEPSSTERLGNSRYQTSWIWMVTGVDKEADTLEG